MSANSSIEWTDRTWNPVRGCSVISPGCVNCYAMKQAHRFSGPGKAYEGLTKLTERSGPQWTGKVVTVEDALLEPLSWRKPSRVFVNSMSDLFHEDVPDAFIDKVFAVMGLAERHTFQILTKRADRMLQYMTSRPASPTVPGEVNIATESGLGVYHVRWPLPNVWLGVSVENQPMADKRIPELLKTPAAVRFISVEPLLGPVNLDRYGWITGCDACCNGDRCPGPPECTRYDRRSCPVCKGTARGVNLDWVILGGESGPGARPFDLQWARSIVAQCQAASVPVFVKQLGAVPIQDEAEWRAGDGQGRVSLLSARNHRRTPEGFVPIAQLSRKGGDMAEWPADLQVRQFPEARA